MCVLVHRCVLFAAFTVDYINATTMLRWINIAAYAFCYYATRNAIPPLVEKNQKAFAPYEEYLQYGLLVGLVIVGMLADFVGPRTAVNVTHLGSLAIYAAAAALLAPKGMIPFPVPREAVLALKFGTVLQHSMAAIQAATAVTQTGARGIAIALCQVGVFYSVGMVGGNVAKARIPNAFEVSALAAAVTFVLILINLIAWSNKVPAAAAAGRKTGTLTLVLRHLPLLVFMLLVRASRMWLNNTSKAMQAKHKVDWPFGEYAGMDYGVGFVMQLIGTPCVLMIVGGNAVLGTTLAMMIAAAVRGVVLAGLKEVQPEHIVYAIAAVSSMLYVLPTAAAAALAAPGTRGRVMALAGVVTYSMYVYADKLYKEADTRVSPLLKDFGVKSAEEKDVIIIAGTLLVASVCLIVAAATAPRPEAVKPAAPIAGKKIPAKPKRS